MSNQPILAAEFTNGSKSRPAQLSFNWIANGGRCHIDTRPVAGKREARRLAAERGATPWNF